MEIKVRIKELKEEVAEVILEGEIDVYTSPKVKETLNSLIAEGQRFLVINLEEVTYIDSTGLGVLIGALKRIREKNGNIKLICTNLQIKKIFEITGLVKIFAIYGNEQEALESLT